MTKIIYLVGSISLFESTDQQNITYKDLKNPEFYDKLNLQVDFWFEENIEVIKETKDYYCIQWTQLDEDEDNFSENIYKYFKEDQQSINTVIWPKIDEISCNASIYIKEEDLEEGKKKLKQYMKEMIELHIKRYQTMIKAIENCN